MAETRSTDTGTRVLVNTSTTQVQISPTDQTNVVVSDTTDNRVIINDPNQQESIQRVAPVINSVRVLDQLRQSVVSDITTNTVVISTGPQGIQGIQGVPGPPTDTNIANTTLVLDDDRSFILNNSVLSFRDDTLQNHNESLRIHEDGITIGANNGATAFLRLRNANDGNSLPNVLSLRTPSDLSADITYTLPGTILTDGFLTTDSEGALTFTDQIYAISMSIDFRSNSELTDDTLHRLPIIGEGVGDGSYPLLAYSNGFNLRVKRSNRYDGTYKTDELQIGNGSTAGGGIRLESTGDNPTYISTDGGLFIIENKVQGIELRGAVSASSHISASKFVGDGSQLTNIVAAQADKILVDANNTGNSFHIPMYNPTAGYSGYNDGYYALKNPINELFYYNRATNPITDLAQGSDYLHVGGAQNTAGGIWLNSTVGRDNFIYSNFNSLLIQADDRFQTHNPSYPARIEISTYTGSLAATGVPNYISLESTEIQFTGSLKSIPHSEVYPIHFTHTGTIDAKKSYIGSTTYTTDTLNFAKASLIPAGDFFDRLIPLTDKGTTDDLYVQGFVQITGFVSMNTSFRADIFHTQMSGSMPLSASFIKHTGFDIPLDPTTGFQTVYFSGSISSAVDSIQGNSMIMVGLSNTSNTIQLANGTTKLSAFLTHRYTK